MDQTTVSDVFGYIGIGLSMIYRIPQIYKILRTRKAQDVSKTAVSLHNLTYVCLITYICLKEEPNLIFLSYYGIGFAQNAVVLILTFRYDPNPDGKDIKSEIV